MHLLRGSAYTVFETPQHGLVFVFFFFVFVCVRVCLLFESERRMGAPLEAQPSKWVFPLSRLPSRVHHKPYCLKYRHIMCCVQSRLYLFILSLVLSTLSPVIPVVAPSPSFLFLVWPCELEVNAPVRAPAVEASYHDDRQQLVLLPPDHLKQAGGFE